jgi:multidrug efflux pump subunit AcrA (membrane-fusion protein)
VERNISIAQMELQDIMINLSFDITNTRLMQDAETKRLDIERLETNLNHTRAIQALNLNHERTSVEEIRSTLIVTELLAPYDGIIVYVDTSAVSIGSTIPMLAFTPIIYISRHDDLFIELATTAAMNINPRTTTVYAVIEGHTFLLTRRTLTVLEAQRYSRNSIIAPLRFNIEGINEHVRLGQFVLIQIVTQVAENVLRIPINTLLSDNDGGFYVYVNDNGAKVQRWVETGIRNPVWVEIHAGLTEQDEVMVMEEDWYEPLEEGVELFVTS